MEFVTMSGSPTITRTDAGSHIYEAVVLGFYGRSFLSAPSAADAEILSQGLVMSGEATVEGNLETSEAGGQTFRFSINSDSQHSWVNTGWIFPAEHINDGGQPEIRETFTFYTKGTTRGDLMTHITICHPSSRWPNTYPRASGFQNERVEAAEADLNGDTLEILQGTDD